MKTPIAILLIGPPASGKTTFRETIVTSDNEIPEVISTDDIIEAYAAENSISYDKAWFKNHQAHKKAKEKFELAVSQKEYIMIDRTNMTKNDRAEYIKTLQENSYYIKAIIFDGLSYQNLKDRLDKRFSETQKYIPEDVLKKIVDSYEEPTLEEFDEILHISTDNNIYHNRWN